MILFVGSTSELLGIAAANFNKLSKLILKDDIANINDIKIGHISVGDHNLTDFIYVISCATEIYYIDDGWDNLTAKLITEYHLRLASHKIIVHNINKKITLPDQMLALVDSRKEDSSQLWAVGCSFTTAVGVDNKDRWGTVLGDQLNLPVSFLAQASSSIQWAADQILRSDIRKDDIVVWGVTGVSRFPYYNNNLVIHVNKAYYNSNKSFNSLINEQLLVADHMTYCSITALEQVILHSQLIGYKLILMQFPLNIESQELLMLNYLSQFDFFVHVYSSSTDKFIDYGTDNVHPGPKQHNHYAKLIIDHLI